LDALPGLLAALFVTGLVSGVHCLGMCGGIVAAFSARRAIPVRAATDWGRQIVFNLGRISAYAAAGAAAGALGGAAAFVAGAAPAQAVLYLLANLMLVLVGLYLAGAGRWLARIEAAGAPLWRRLQPHAARLLGARTLPRIYAAGLVWGFLPCGLVYGALAAAAFAGSPAAGAAAMLAFGAGTLPNLLAAGLAAARLRASLARRGVRLAAGGLVLGFGVFGLAQAGGVAETVRRGLLSL
jgi:sulfite exporter TauE/SafE